MRQVIIKLTVSGKLIEAGAHIHTHLPFNHLLVEFWNLLVKNIELRGKSALNLPR